MTFLVSPPIARLPRGVNFFVKKGLFLAFLATGLVLRSSTNSFPRVEAFEAITFLFRTLLLLLLCLWLVHFFLAVSAFIKKLYNFQFLRLARAPCNRYNNGSVTLLSCPFASSNINLHFIVLGSYFTDILLDILFPSFGVLNCGESFCP